MPRFGVVVSQQFPPHRQRPDAAKIKVARRSKFALPLTTNSRRQVRCARPIEVEMLLLLQGRRRRRLLGYFKYATTMIIFPANINFSDGANAHWARSRKNCRHYLTDYVIGPTLGFEMGARNGRTRRRQRRASRSAMRNWRRHRGVLLETSLRGSRDFTSRRRDASAAAAASLWE